jgi:outer membrane lipoprotein SlyB
MAPVWARATAVASLLLVAGCATSTRNVYDSADVGRVIETSEGTVVASRVVSVKEDVKGYGPAIGGIAGATGAGLTIGRGSGSGLAALFGGLLGLGAGYAAEQMAREREGIEYVIRTADGRTTTLVQNRDKEEAPMAPGTTVLVQHAGRYTRVIEKPDGLDDWKNPDGTPGQKGAPGGGGKGAPQAGAAPAPQAPPAPWRYGSEQAARQPGTIRPLQ